MPDIGGVRISNTITTEVTIELDIQTAAKWFSGLSDDEMCKFFVAVAAEAESWPGSAETMWWYVGRHLRECECSTELARDLIRGINRAMEHGNA